MMLWLALAAIFLIGLGAAFMAARRVSDARKSGTKTSSLPTYHGVHAFLWAVVPALLVLAMAQPIQNELASAAILATPEGQALPAFAMERNVIIAEARDIAHGRIATSFHEQANALAPVVKAMETRYGLIGLVASIAASLLGALFALWRGGANFAARNGVERWVMGLLIAASLVAVLTTFGIVASLLFESIRFFSEVGIIEFLFGTKWNPAGYPGEFGSLSLFWGTAFIGAIIAMIVAVPLGLLSAIYLSQYAAPTARKWLKPTLEILAGVPTVVYGYFAALTVAPLVRDFGLAIGLSNVSSESALAAGLVMGIMIVPLISSMADDSLTAVPGAMRDGSLALGATPSETIRQVLFPAALPGIVGGVLLAVSRAIGETMIVVMAAGLAANMTANPFASVTTVTVQIVKLLTGDQEFDSAKTLAAFALGLVLFIVTLALNLYALRIVRKYREAYD